MPYKISKLKNGKYQVKNIDKNTIKAKGTTLDKALKMIKLLHYVDHEKKNK